MALLENHRLRTKGGEDKLLEAVFLSPDRSRCGHGCRGENIELHHVSRTAGQRGAGQESGDSPACRLALRRRTRRVPEERRRADPRHAGCRSPVPPGPTNRIPLRSCLIQTAVPSSLQRDPGREPALPSTHGPGWIQSRPMAFCTTGTICTPCRSLVATLHCTQCCSLAATLHQDRAITDALPRRAVATVLCGLLIWCAVCF